ncbi:MerR family transcriptional regulator [Pseudocnuella soli]|uniref:MerR family transcriptional regulator n=1 Tax=Pseudocnuella soli TaxID=2502779 RepID=UPI001046FEF0|nr:MerR family transcriptional regulator [Pseudocnuella soli]
MGFSIKELETISGIKAHTIRIWEQRYHFLKPSRTATNIRTYSNDELKTLLTVALLNRYGYKISRIDEMPPEKRREAIMGINSPEAAGEFLINELIGCMVDLRSLDFELILNSHIREHGLEKTITTLIFQFLEKVGILWQTDRINPAQEHIVSNIIRQKIICGIEYLPMPFRTGPEFLLFLPEGEFHEMGLLFVYYLLKKRGLPVVYLGANVPLKDLGYVVEIKQPQFIYLHLTTAPSNTRFERLLHQLGQYNAQALISGFVASRSYSAMPNIRFLQSLPEVVQTIDTL